MQVSSCAKCHALYPNDDLNERGKCQDCSGNKYHARKVTVNGRRYDSQHEATMIEPLFWRQAQGEIDNLRRQVRFDFVVNDLKSPHFYKADATYNENGTLIVIDAKGYRTKEYKLKRWLMLACHGITIIEV
jgi:hypothetical protein